MLVVVSLFHLQLHADEGMWLLSLIREVNMDEMTEMGLQLTAEQIYSVNQSSLKDAVGALDGGSCTAELVSPDGLLLTNHHCGYDEIQFHSTVENDYLKNGFWALTREDELPNEGKTITFLVRMEEVTGRVLEGISEEMSQVDRYSKIRSAAAEITAEAMEGNHYEARIHSMYNDNRYFLFITETYRDVRLVGAPPESIGKFGGDTDNWMWPRHTGDFSMFRVYTDPDGKPADYSPDNIPLKSKHYFPVSLKGYDKGDFTMVLGYPGSTDRYITSWEVRELLEVIHPNRIRIRGVKQDLMMEDMRADEKVRLQYASKYSRSSNSWKYSIGQSRGLVNLDVVAKKQKQEEAFREWVKQRPEREAIYGDALENIRKAVEGRRQYANAMQYIEETIFRGGMESVLFARNLGQLEQALSHPDPDPEGIQEVVSGLKEISEIFYKDYNPSTDKKVMTAMVSLLQEDLDERFLPQNILEVKTKYNGDAEKYVEKYFKKSIVPDRAKFLAFLEDPSLKVLRKDPAFQAAKAADKYFEIRGGAAEFEESYDRGSRLFLRGLIEMYPEKDFYSDANSTLRLNYGTVGDYKPRDGVRYLHHTTLEGVMEKEEPESYEFTVPERLKELYREKDYGPYGSGGTMHVCFTSNNDITGGNSGSPVINASGELIGIAFDGNWEAMSGDVAFEEELQKCISVDIRYVLFLIDRFAGARHLVDEMTLIW
ncbi:MAG TPA: S46 family peptidase [Bacteroides sp.]|nr:S46 family peptidase [Bacteroides sp.]